MFFNTSLYKKEELIEHFITENNFKIISLCETDVEFYDEKKPFSLKGFTTFHPTKRDSQKYQRLLLLVSNDIECIQREDLQSFDNTCVWIELSVPTVNREYSCVLCTESFNSHNILTFQHVISQ